MSKSFSKDITSSTRSRESAPKSSMKDASFLISSILIPSCSATVAEQLGIKIEEIKNEASFMDDLGADSLDLVELVMSFENDFDITIPDEDSNEITTVQSAIDYVSKKLG